MVPQLLSCLNDAGLTTALKRKCSDCLVGVFAPPFFTRLSAADSAWVKHQAGLPAVAGATLRNSGDFLLQASVCEIGAFPGAARLPESAAAVARVVRAGDQAALTQSFCNAMSDSQAQR
jgi:hypothetical protein